MSKEKKSSPSFLTSTVGRKIITGITGIGLCIFIILHLAGNLTLLSSNPDSFNEYAHFLNSWGWFLDVLEIILLAFFVFHIVMGISVWLRKKKARPQGYIKYQSAGRKSRQTLSSRSMIITGIVLLVFLIIHLAMFEYGPGIAQGYVTTINGIKMRDLHRVVVQAFTNPWWVIFYVAVMVFLGYHLRHGFWSMFQSLGALKPKWTPLIYTIGVIFAIIMAVGFLFIPIFIYFKFA